MPKRPGETVSDVFSVRIWPKWSHFIDSLAKKRSAGGVRCHPIWAISGWFQPRNPGFSRSHQMGVPGAICWLKKHEVCLVGGLGAYLRRKRPPKCHRNRVGGGVWVWLTTNLVQTSSGPHPDLIQTSSGPAHTSFRLAQQHFARRLCVGCAGKSPENRF